MWLDHVVVDYLGVIRTMAMARSVGNALYRLHAGRRQSMTVAMSSRYKCEDQ